MVRNGEQVFLIVTWMVMIVMTMMTMMMIPYDSYWYDVYNKMVC